MRSVINRKLNLNNVNNINFQVGIEDSTFSRPEGTGVWYVSGVSAGAPNNTTQWGILFQMRSPKSIHPTTRDAVYVQIFTNVYGNAWLRVLNNNSWTAWKAL